MISNDVMANNFSVSLVLPMTVVVNYEYVKSRSTFACCIKSTSTVPDGFIIRVTYRNT